MYVCAWVSLCVYSDDDGAASGIKDHSEKFVYGTIIAIEKKPTHTKKACCWLCLTYTLFVITQRKKKKKKKNMLLGN